MSADHQEDSGTSCKDEFSEAVIVLHGIGRTRKNMFAVESRLAKSGYKPYSFSYPSVSEDIPSLANWLSKRLDDQDVWGKHQRVHFVTHSMGGLVAGEYLAHVQENNADALKKMGRVVMMGVPHGGSMIADLLHENWLYKRIFGPAGQQLTTEFRQAQPLAPWYELGVIAGTSRWSYPLGSLIMDGEHDGRVSVESTKIPDMKDHITMPVMHWSMVFQPSVLDQVEHFLVKGSFQP